MASIKAFGLFCIFGFIYQIVCFSRTWCSKFYRDQWQKFDGEFSVIDHPKFMSVIQCFSVLVLTI